jgi:hypothetical protein
MLAEFQLHLALCWKTAAPKAAANTQVAESDRDNNRR